MRANIHYSWIIVLTGALILFACLGLGRFTLGILLPSMGETLRLSYAEMGMISTGNFIGYLLAVVLVHHLVARIGARNTIVLSLLVIALSMFLVSLGRGFISILLLYFITGMGSGGANVPLMGLVSHWFRRDKRGKAAGYMLSGNGLAIMLTGVMVPAFNLLLGAQGWRLSWAVMAAIALLTAGLALRLLHNHPEDIGESALGHHVEPPATHLESLRAHRKTILHLGTIYFMFGFSYVIYITFIATTLVSEHGMSGAEAGNFWFWVGFFSLFSGPLFGTLSDRLGRKTGLIVVYLLQGSAYLLIALGSAQWAIYLSIFLFGICAWSVPTIMAAATGDYMGAHHAVAAFGSITLFFSFGQISGPALAGFLAETSGSFFSSYLLASAASLSAVILLLSLRRPG